MLHVGTGAPLRARVPTGTAPRAPAQTRTPGERRIETRAPTFYREYLTEVSFAGEDVYYEESVPAARVMQSKSCSEFSVFTSILPNNSAGICFEVLDVSFGWSDESWLDRW